MAVGEKIKKGTFMPLVEEPSRISLFGVQQLLAFSNGYLLEVHKKMKCFLFFMSLRDLTL